MYVFIVVVWIFLFNKYMIQNPVFFTGIPVVVIKRFCFFCRFFFFLRHKMEELRNSTQWSLGPQNHDN